MPRLSFCLIATFYPPQAFGGDAIHAIRLANGLVERGHRVRVVHGGAAYRMLARGEAPMGGFSHHPDIELQECPATRRGVVATYLTGKPLGYRRDLERLVDGFDVIQLSNPTLVGGPGGFELGSGLKLYTAHEHWLMCPTHLLFRYNREVCTNRTCWRCTAVYGRPPQPWRSTGLLPRAMRHVDLLFCLSRFAAELHRREFPDARIEVLPPLGPDAARLAGVPPARERDRPYFLFAGRLEPIKGVDRLIRAFADVRGADLLVAGDGGELPELRRLADTVPAVQMLGRISNDEVLSLCRGARALVFPSIGYEGFPLIMVEAMALGAAIVARDLGSTPEILERGGGLLFADDGALARALQRLVDEPATARTLGEEARALFEERYTEAHFFRHYLGAISRVAADTDRHELAVRAGDAAEAEPAYAEAR